MDPVTQGVLGASVGQAASRASDLRAAAVLAALSGMAPDLDVLIRSDVDPLLFLEYHRHFTHSLVFIPFGALLCAGVFHWFVRGRFSFVQTWLYCLLGYATHGLLDACTTYGTQLFWPFSNVRVAWNAISVVDPLFTVPALGLVIASFWWSSLRLAWIALAWMGLYMGFGAVQNVRAEQAGAELAASRGHAPVSISAKPGFANLLLWKVVYEVDGVFHVDAIRVGFDVDVYEGQRARRLDVARDLPWLDPDSQQARDIERFRWFSNDHLAVLADVPYEVADIRYSLLPNEVAPLWGIRLDPAAAADAHVAYYAARDPSPQRQRRLLRMLRGLPLEE